MAKAEKPNAARKPARKPVDPATVQREQQRLALLEAQSAPHNPDGVPKFGKKKSPAILEAFLTWLRKGYSPKYAAEKCGVGRDTFFAWRNQDEEFKAAWFKAIDEGTDVFEDEARRRAVDGVTRPVFQMGECVGHTQEYSDSLLTMQMKGRRPERYGDKVAHTGGDGGAIKHHIEVEFVKPGEE